jgi:cytochrome c5
MCHGNSAVGAPVLGNKADWEPRIAQGKDVLYMHALQGFSGQKGAMPAHGGNPSLHEDAVKAAVDYMVSQVK